MIHTKIFTSFTLASVVFCLQFCTSEPASGPPEESEAASLEAIQTLLNKQVDAWNAGDIPAFMEGYWESDSLRFASGGSVRRGYDETLQRYFSSYPDKAAMGFLAFEDLEMRRLSPQWTTVFGRFRLKREAPLDDLTGLFTLIFEKRDGEWIIVSDHTSAG